MILALQESLAAQVRAVARATLGAEPDAVAVQYPPRIELGDLALTVPFDLAKTLRRKPREIAEALCPELGRLPGIKRAEVAGGGYLNLFLDRGAFAGDFSKALASPQPPKPVPGPVIVEHTSINPNKAAHIGHIRNATLGDTLVRVLRSRGYSVGVQNYIDDTGVQVADVVVGFMHLEKLGLAAVEAIPSRFDYYCWDLYARVGDFYAADPAHKARQTEVLHAIEAGDNDTARLAAHVAERIVDCHLATMWRLGIRYDLLAHESDILRLHFWERAFELLKASGALRLEADGKNAGCWVLAMAGDPGATGNAVGAPAAEASAPRGRDSLPATRKPDEGPEPGRGSATGEAGRIDDARRIDEDKVIVRSNGTVTYTGKDIAYQLWKLGRLDRDFRYRRHHVDPDGHVVWSTTSGEGEAGAPSFGHARAAYNVIDVGQSYPQRVVKAGVAALGYPQAAAASHHLGYEKVVLSPATARALGYSVSEDEAAVKVSGRKGLGVKADDLLDALIAKAESEIAARDPGRAPEARRRDATAIAIGALRYFLLKFGRTKIITFDMEEALAFVGETGPYVQNSVVRARNIFAKLEAEGRSVAALREQAGRLELGPLLESEEGGEVWSLLLLLARCEEAMEQAVRAQEVAPLAKHAFAIAQAFHAYYQKPKYSILYAESDGLRAFRVLVVDAFIRQMEVLASVLGIPIPDRM